jgi:glycosyltransferase involved in cell wall biosynthesis
VRTEIPCPAIDGIHRAPVPRYCDLVGGKVAGQNSEEWQPLVIQTAEDDAAKPLPRSTRFIRPWDSKGPIKLGLAAPGLNVGGAERWILDLIDATSTPPFRWEGLVVRFETEAFEPMKSRIESRVPVALGPDALRELGQRVDILIHWGVPELHAILGPDAGCRTVLTSHGACDWTRRAVADADHATGLVAVSKAAVGPYPEPEQARVRVIYNAANYVPPTKTREEMHRAWGVPPGKKVLGFLGRIAPDKYPESVPLAISKLPSEWVGVLVGLFPERLDPIVAELGLQDRIFRPGVTSEPHNALAGFDLMMQASVSEGCSLSIIEAWLASVPVIATVTGFTEEMPELIRAVPQAADAETLKAAVLADADDPEGTRARVEHAREFAETNLSPDRFRAEWRAFLAGLVKREAARPAATSAPRPSAAPAQSEITSLVRVINACPHRGPQSGGCQSCRPCALGKGKEPGRVFFHDCAACVKADPEKWPPK